MTQINSSLSQITPAGARLPASAGEVAQQEQRQETPGFVQTAIDAGRLEWTGAWMARTIARSTFEPDPDFPGVFTDEDRRKFYLENIDSRFWPRMAEANSDAQALYIRQQIDREQKSLQRLESLGYGGIAARLGASIFDPINVITGAATGGIGWVNRGSRLSMIAKEGLVNAAAATALDTVRATMDESMTAESMVYNAAGAFAFGSAIKSATTSKRLARAIDALKRETIGDEFGRTMLEMNVVEAPLGQNAVGGVPYHMTKEFKDAVDRSVLTEQGRMTFRRDLAQAERRKVIDQLIDDSELDPDIDADTIASIRSMRDDDALQAAFELSTPPPELYVRTDTPPRGAGVDEAGGPPAGGAGQPLGGVPPARGDGLEFFNVNESRTELGRARFSLSSKLGVSESLTARIFGLLGASDSLKRKAEDGTFLPLVNSASEWVRRTSNADALARTTINRKHLDTYLTKHDLGFIEGDKAFQNQQGRFKRWRTMEMDQSVKQAVQEKDALWRANLERAKQAGVPEFMAIEHDPRYMTVVYDQIAVRGVIESKATRSDGIAALGERISQAFKSANPDADDALSGRVGRGMARIIANIDEPDIIRVDRVMRMDRDELRRLLQEEAGDLLDEGAVEGLVRRLIPESPQGGSPRGMRRTLLDHSMIDDLIIHDHDMLLEMYSRAITGRIAEHRTFQELAAQVQALKGLKEPPPLATIQDTFKIARDEGATPSELDTMDVVWRHMRGFQQRQDLAWNSPGASFLRSSRAVNQMLYSGQFAFATTTELGNIVGEVGAKTLYRAMPAMDSLLKTLRTDADALSQLESMGLGGSETIARSLNIMHGDWDNPTMGRLGRAEAQIRRGTNVVGKVTGQYHANLLTARLATVAAMQKVADEVGRDAFDARVLMNYGLNESQARRVGDSLKKEIIANNRGGIWKFSHAPVNWEDAVAGRLYTNAVQKGAERMIQVNDIGSGHRLTNNEIAKVLTQFRNFPIHAWDKQFLPMVQDRNMAQVYQKALYTTMMGTLVYIAQTHLQAIGREDRDKYLDKRLGMYGAATPFVMGWSRSGWSSLIPMVADQVGSLTALNKINGGDPFFGFGRTSGLDASGLLQNPTFATMTSVARTVQSAGEMAAGLISGRDRYTQSDFQAFRTLVPLQRMIGISNILDAIQTRLPESERSALP